MNVELKNEAVDKLKFIIDETSGMLEEDHIEADKILCDLLVALGYQEVVNEFENVPKWYA